ncbi:MAG: hypothetical protein JXK93_14465 [Sphaerochaetaceae bacterium]|nr:hypothetical protein [Sphaerochaetaceae bacterium]
MRKTGLYIILGIIISLTVFVLAGILYFQPQTAAQPEVVRPMTPKEEPVSTPLQKEPAVKEAAVPAESVPDAEVDIQVPPPVALSMKVTPYVPPVEFVEVGEVAEADQAAPVESVVEFKEVVQEEVADLQTAETEGELVEELILPEEAEDIVSETQKEQAVLEGEKAGEDVPAPEMKQKMAELEADQAAEDVGVPEMKEEQAVLEGEKAGEDVPAPEMKQKMAELEADQAAEDVGVPEMKEEPVELEAEDIIAPETVIEEEVVVAVKVPETKGPITTETVPVSSPQRQETVADEAAIIEKKMTAEPVEEFIPEVFTPSAATLWIVKNSMPVLFAPEILAAPEPYEGGEPEFVSPGSFLSTAEDKRRDAVDSLFDLLQF